MWIVSILQMIILTICFITTLIVTMLAYGIMILISFPFVIIIFPFALIKAGIELKKQKNKLDKEE